MGCKFKPVIRGLDFLEPAKLMASVRYALLISPEGNKPEIDYLLMGKIVSQSNSPL